MNIDELLMYIQPFMLTNDVYNKSRITLNELIIDEYSNTNNKNEEMDILIEIDKNTSSSDNQIIDVNINKNMNIDNININVCDNDIDNHNNENENENEDENNIMINKSKQGIIYQKDPIFWCIYIHQNGIKEYQLNKKKTFEYYY